MSTNPTPDEQDIESRLGHLDKDDLISLIKRMVQQHPDLTGLIVSSEQAAIKKPRVPFNAEVYRLQVEKIFRTTDRKMFLDNLAREGILLYARGSLPAPLAARQSLQGVLADKGVTL